MALFAAEIAAQDGLPIPDVSDPYRSLAPYLEQAWGLSGMGEGVGALIDAAGALDIAAPALDALGGLDVLKVVPVGPVVQAIVQAVRTARNIQVLAGQSNRIGRIAREFYGIDRRRFDKPVDFDAATLEKLNPAWAVAFFDRVQLPDYTDCRPTGAARLRPVLPPQKMSAPWYTAADYNGSGYPQPEGNCGKGYAVGCGPIGDGRNKWPGAGGKPCKGFADFSALLYPWWVGSLEPGPAPALLAADVPKNLTATFYVADANPPIIAAQAEILGTMESNFRVSLERVVRHRQAMIDLLGKGRTMRVAPSSANYRLTDEILNVGITMCDAFIAARASFAASPEGLAYLQANRGAPGLDVDAAREAARVAKDGPIVGGTGKAKAPSGKTQAGGATVVPLRKGKPGTSVPWGVVLPFILLAFGLDTVRGKL